MGAVANGLELHQTPARTHGIAVAILIVVTSGTTGTKGRNVLATLAIPLDIVKSLFVEPA
jgi:hypothetical protein